MNRAHKSKHIRIAIFALYLFLTGIARTVCAQDTILIISDSTNAVVVENGNIQFEKTSTFKPNPQMAWQIAMVFPGFGQIYNRQYWKLPIVYGGVTACIYAITWNNKTYNDYKLAYFDIMMDSRNDFGENRPSPDEWSTSWQDFSSADPATLLHSSSFQNQLKRGKDYFRRYRDLSIIIGVGLYLIIVADSYVDAQMFDFDVSQDLSFRITPEIRPETLSSPLSFGVNVCMTF